MAMDPASMSWTVPGIDIPVTHLPHGACVAPKLTPHQNIYNSAAPTYIPTYTSLDSTAIIGAWRDGALALAPACQCHVGELAEKFLIVDIRQHSTSPSVLSRGP
jgi:hypothetical protein